MRVALYARVSTQRQEKQGTIGSQVETLRRHAAGHDYAIAEDYVCTDDGYSGALLARPQLDRLRDGAQTGAFDAVLVLSPDRLSRKYAYLILILEEFERLGISVIFLEQPPGDDPHSVLLVQIQGAVAEYERAKIAERYRRGKLYRARNGEVFWASIPYGYRRIPRKDGVAAHLIIDEGQADVVRKVFEWHAHEGMSVRQIAARVGREGYPTPKGGKRWGETTIHRILRREAYVGTLYYNRSREVSVAVSERNPRGNTRVERSKSEWISVSVPPIIDRETFERSLSCHKTNEQFSPRNLHEEHWLLRRLVRCEKCGLKCGCVADKRRPYMPPAYYYRCDKQYRVEGRPRCRPNHIRAQPLDDLVWEEIRQHLLHPEFLLKAQASLEASQSLDASVLIVQMTNLHKLLEQLDAQRRRLIDAYQEAFISKEEFESRVSGLARRIESVRKDLRSLEDEHHHVLEGHSLLGRIQDFTSEVSGRLDTMSFSEKQALVRTVVQEVVISDNTVKIYFKIPLPSQKAEPGKTVQSKPRKQVSSELDLRSRGSHGRRNLTRWDPLAFGKKGFSCPGQGPLRDLSRKVHGACKIRSSRGQIP